MEVLHVSDNLQQQRLWHNPQESLDSPIDRRSDYYRQRARQKRPPQLQASSAAPPAQRLLTAPNVLTFLRVLLVRRTPVSGKSSEASIAVPHRPAMPHWATPCTACCSVFCPQSGSL